MRVCIIEFMKGDMYSGEIEGIKRLSPNVELYLTGKGFCGIMGNQYPFEEHRANAQDALKFAKEKMFSKSYDILILDEINNALKLKLLDLPQVLELIENKPPLMHLILTGRDAHPDVDKKSPYRYRSERDKACLQVRYRATEGNRLLKLCQKFQKMDNNDKRSHHGFIF